MFRSSTGEAEKVQVNVERLAKYVGEKRVLYWKADVYHAGGDYHAVGSNPQEALLRAAVFWHGRAVNDPDAAAKATAEALADAQR
jgi:hypothetical protein